ncbi:MAG TPA: hypothetical protein VGK30_06330 [Candidatus Binatia bacterium]|jgi:hypothetical protein
MVLDAAGRERRRDPISPVGEYMHQVRNSLNGPIMRAAMLRELAREIRSRSAALRLRAQEVRAARPARPLRAA